MRRDEILERIKRDFKDRVEIWERSPKRIYITVDKTDAKPLCQMLFQEFGARFITASGVDTRSGIEILYHFSLDKLGMVVSVRSLSEKPFPEFESLTSFLPASQWIEREIHELLGVNFKGHPDLRKLILPDDWPEGEYPLRRKELKE
ncbi:TPA: NADH-quinone oxidoreductase subunit C [Candidatus Poribacteria bacterium]|nr:NADH-quinone oxidoreductase subunit C [Candidatus Poribacteria bacterium]